MNHQPKNKDKLTTVLMLITLKNYDQIEKRKREQTKTEKYQTITRVATINLSILLVTATMLNPKEIV